MVSIRRSDRFGGAGVSMSTMAQMRALRHELALLVNACRHHARDAAAVSGKSVVRQVAEICALRLGLGKLNAEEYYDYGLYDDRHFSWKAKKKFFGRAMENKLCEVLNTGSWHALAWDKVLTNIILEAGGIPTARILAVYDHGRHLGTVQCLRSRADVVRFLHTTNCYPLVCKPTWGISGYGVIALDGIDKGQDRLLLPGGQGLAVQSFVEALPSPGWKQTRKGVLFQERLSPHPLILTTCGDRICSLRLIVLITDEGPRIAKAYWKIAAGANFIDNFQRGVSGNLVATVDLRTGVIMRCVAKGASGRPVLVSVHPDTGEDLTALQLPFWETTMDLTAKAAGLMPGLRMQAWDVAVCAEGPVFLEVNVIGGFNLPQVAEDAGVYDADLQTYLKQFGFGS